MRRRLVLGLLVATVFLGGCDSGAGTTGESDRTPMPILEWFPTSSVTPSPTPARTAPAVTGDIPFCGASFEWHRGSAPNTAARECLLRASVDGVADMLLVDATGDALVVTRLVATPRAIQGNRVVMEGARDPIQTHTFVQCEDLNATGDTWVFDEPSCLSTADSGVAFNPDAPSLMQQYCGISVIRFSTETAHEDAQRCLLQAFEGAASARLYQVLFTVEGDPIVSIYTVRPGEVHTYTDAHDSFGAQRESAQVCTDVDYRRAPLVFDVNPESCTEVPVGR